MGWSDKRSARTERAKWLLNHCRFAAMATVNEDGSPHNTPYMFMKSEDLEYVYWGSHPNSLHSKNITRTGRLFVVMYQAPDDGGVYIRCSNARMAKGEELVRALAAHNAIRAEDKRQLLDTSYYADPNEQRMYVADTDAFWINHAEPDSDGRLREDLRHELNREDLTSN